MLPQPIFSLPRKFQEEKKNTGAKIEDPLTDLGITLGKIFRFLYLPVTENVL